MGTESLPAEPVFVALYFVKLLQSANTFSVIKTASAAISAFHDIAGRSSPCVDRLASRVREAVHRILAAPAKKKKPLSIGNVVSIVDRFAPTVCALDDLYLATAVSFGFFGFFRFSDLACIRLEWVRVFSTHLEVFLEKRKNDQFREGHWIVLCAKPGASVCPVALFKRYVARASLSGNAFIFPKAYQPFYSQFKAALEAIGLDATKYGTQSMRSGGATLAAELGVPDRIWREHGGWKSEKAANGYIQTSVSTKLSLTAAMLASL